MIDRALTFLVDEINRGLRALGGPSADSTPDPVRFPLGDSEPIAFPIGHVTVLLVNVGYDNLLRPADPHRRSAPDGAPQRIKPEVRIDLSVLFVARYGVYTGALKVLSDVIQFLQEHPVFERGEYPGLPAELDRLLIEPVSLSFAAQNEVWNALRVTYQPSLLYRVSTLIFRDRFPADRPPITETDWDLRQRR